MTDTQKLDETLGDQYLFVALDQRTKLIACHQIGKRNDITTRAFIARLANRIVLPESTDGPWDQKPQLSTDGWASYPLVVYRFI